MGPRHDLSFCACNTAWLAPELLVSMGPNPYLWFLHAKRRLLEQNYKYLCVPDLICVFCMQNSDFWTRITKLYGSQTSPVVLCMQYSVISTRITCLYGSQPSSEVLAHITSCLAQESIYYIGSSPHLCVFFHAKQRLYDQTYKSVWVPDLICSFEYT